MAIIKRYVNWYNIQKYIECVADKYESYFTNTNNIPGVYGLPRGGLIFAVLLSHKMNIPLLQAPIENCIIIDDICDTGESLLHYYKNSSSLNKPKYHITTMYYKKNNLVEPEYWFEEKKNEWIVYPWEV